MAAKKIGKYTIRVGDKVKVIGDQAGHMVPIGTVSIVTRVRPNPGDESLALINIKVSGYNLYAKDVTVVQNTIKELEEKLGDLEAEASDVRSQIATMKEYGLKEFNESTIQMLRVFSEIDKKQLSPTERAKEVAKMLEGFRKE